MDHQSGEDIADNEELWQPPSSQSDLILYWEYWHLDPQHERDREWRVYHTLLHSPPPIPPEACSAWRHATIFKHAVIGITHVHPLSSVTGAVNRSPTPRNSAGSLTTLASEKPTLYEYWRGFLACSVCVCCWVCLETWSVESNGLSSAGRAVNATTRTCKIYRVLWTLHREERK